MFKALESACFMTSPSEVKALQSNVLFELVIFIIVRVQCQPLKFRWRPVMSNGERMTY
jgi:hypothetical protein